MSKKVQISSGGIRRMLRKYTPLQAVCEYIWNGYDAGANTVELKFSVDEFGALADLRIEDNGVGIKREELENKFTPFFESEKIIDPFLKHQPSASHGKNGVGRLTFFHFAKEKKSGQTSK